MARYTLMVFTRPVAGRVEEYNRWYDQTHLSDVLRVPGFVGAQRWAAEDGDPATGPRYAAVFDIETDDIDATLAIFDRERQAMPSSSALDPDSVSFALYRAVGPQLARMAAGGPTHIAP
jgi:hypothetical protein